MSIEDKKLLTNLIKIPGVVGFEEPIREYLKTEASKYADEVKIDALGNLIAIVIGTKKDYRVMYMAHMDELGMVVSAIDSKGYLSFYKLGGIDDRILPSRAVRILTTKGEINGIIGLKPPHLLVDQQEKDKTTPWHQLKIDIGVKSRHEALALGIRVGTPIVFHKEILFLNQDDLIVSRGLDDRMGCFTLIKLLKNLKEKRPENTSIIVFTTEEEIGLRGAQVLGPQFHPDLTIACDSISSPDFPGISPAFEGSFEVGGGPTIRLVDNRMVVDSQIVRFVERIAKKQGVTIQYGISGGSTDAAATETSYKGYKALPLCFPVRYTHSTVEVVSLQDLEGLVRLYTAFSNEPIELT